MIAGRYAVLEQLGSGGMGTVVLARDEVLKREVAIKRVHASSGSDAARRIEREAKIGAGLTHPGLVTILDALVEDGELLIVMEHVPGETLADRLERGPLDPAEALAVLRPVAAALDHAHGHGIVHRDVKPANILLGQQGAVKLADLGVALADHVTQITRDGAVIGSLPYMAPEQFGPERATAASDIYALAAVAFEALSGRRARPGSAPLELARAANQDPPELLAAAPHLPAAAGTVLAAGMAQDPDRRPATAVILVQELEAALAPPKPAPATRPTRPVAPLRPTAKPAGGNRRGALAAAAALLAVGIAAVVLVLAGGDDPNQQTAADRPASEEGTPAPERTAAPEATPAAASEDPSSPAGAVRAFYERAARDDFAGAWALAGPRMRSALGGSEETLAANLGSLRAIRFKTLTEGAETAAGVEVQVVTVARHTDRTDRCQGPLLAVPDGAGGYVVEPAGISCTSS